MLGAPGGVWLAERMAPRPRSSASIIWLGVVGLLAAAFLFAPVISGGWCADAPLAERTLCVSFQRSLIGIETNVWLWLAASAVVVVITAAAVRRRRKSRY